MNRSSIKRNIRLILFACFFLVIIFLITTCNRKKQPLLSACLTTEEKVDLEYFFRLLMFENHGVFVLFGSKPLCEMHLSDSESKATDIAFQQWFDSLPDDKRTAFKARMKNKTQEEPELERNPYRGWLAWEKVRKTFEMKRYILRIVPLRGPGRYGLMLVNIQQTSLIMAQNYTIFKNAARMEFNPFQIVFELQNPDSIFWKNVFSIPNHLAKGLLFGFGLKNSILGDLRFTYSNTKVSSELKKPIMKHLKRASPAVSTNQVKYGDGSPSNFTIPLFSPIEGDDTAEKYEKEKIEIEKIYRGKDLVEVTLQRLARF
jgi:hypothetical protein